MFLLSHNFVRVCVRVRVSLSLCLSVCVCQKCVCVCLSVCIFCQQCAFTVCVCVCNNRYADVLAEYHDDDHLVKFEELLEAAVDLDKIPDEYLICASYDSGLQVKH